MTLSPALERTLDLNRRSALTLVAHYQTPAQIRRIGRRRLSAYLRKRRVQGADALARKALTAAETQSATLPAESVAAQIVAELAEEVLSLKNRIDTLDEELERRFFARPEARIVESLPGMGPILGAEFLVAVGDLRAFESADRLAAYAGLVPAARDFPARGWATIAGCEEGTRFSKESSTSLPSLACEALRSPGPSTTGREPRARSTRRL